MHAKDPEPPVGAVSVVPSALTILILKYLPRLAAVSPVGIYTVVASVSFLEAVTASLVSSVTAAGVAAVLYSVRPRLSAEAAATT